MTEKKIPSPEEVQKEFEDFVKSRFGGQVKVFTHSANEGEMFEAPSEETIDIEEKEVFDINFELKPKEIKSYLDRFIIKQDEAKKALSIAVCDHYNQVNAHHKNPEFNNKDYAKQNVLVLGPTGVGKTYMIKQIAKLIGVPFVKADATRFSETGYMGANVDDLIRDLVQQANGNIELAQYGIVYLDEADKLAMTKSQNGKDVNGRGVQLGLLKLMEETEVDLRSGNDPSTQMQAMMEFQRKGRVDKQIVNTKHILFIVSGAFHGLKDIIAKRVNERAIGFNKSPTGNQDVLYHHVTTQDFIDFGFEPEFIGRMPVRVACDHLEASDLYSILKNSEGSIINQYQSSFNAYGIDVIFSDDSLQQIANYAAVEKTGARALMTVCEKIMRDYKFELPSSNIKEFIVTKEVVDDPRGELQKLMSDPQHCKHHMLKKRILSYEKYYFDLHQMKIKFSDEAVEAIIEVVLKQDLNLRDYLNQLLHSYDYGLKLIQQNTGNNQFVLDAEIVTDARGVLEKLIKDSYS